MKFSPSSFKSPRTKPLKHLGKSQSQHHIPELKIDVFKSPKSTIYDASAHPNKSNSGSSGKYFVQKVEVSVPNQIQISTNRFKSYNDPATDRRNNGDSEINILNYEVESRKAATKVDQIDGNNFTLQGSSVITDENVINIQDLINFNPKDTPTDTQRGQFRSLGKNLEYSGQKDALGSTDLIHPSK